MGNMANNLYIRACALAGRELSIDFFLHPHDQFLMSQPSWEEYDGDIPDGITTLQAAFDAGVPLPAVAGVHRHGTVSWNTVQAKNLVGPMPRRRLWVRHAGPTRCPF